MSIEQVQAFNTKFGLPLGDTDQLMCDLDAQSYRVNFLLEELLELKESLAQRDRVGAFDALLDLAYVTYGTALFMGINPTQWNAGMQAVHAANMAKRRVAKPEDSKRKSAFDVQKPDDWVGPENQLEEILTMKTKSLFPMTQLVECSTEELLLELQRRGGHPGALAEAALLCIRKSQDYNQGSKDMDPHKIDRSAYFPFGPMSYAQMIFTKALRFNSLVMKKSDASFESLRDTALDVINYAGFFAAEYPKD